MSDASEGRAWPGTTSDRASAVAAGLRTLQRALEAERDRWFLWLPLFFGLGIGIYYSLLVEPPLWLGLLIAGVALPAAVLAWVHGRFAAAAIGVAAMGLGFAAAELETWSVAAPVLAARIGPIGVEGRVVEVEPLVGGHRIVIEPKHIGSLAADRLPARVRITLRDNEGLPVPGEGVALRATLFPPGPPAMPDAYDFQRRAFFDRIGAVGYAVEPLHDLPGEPAPTWRVHLAALRSTITTRIQAVLPGSTGAIAAAIITGETHAIPDADSQAFRDAGLAHILVIAGLHMGLVAGIAFLAVRFSLACIPFVALRFNTKKLAACAALAVTFAYMLLSGATVSSRRSFLMTALVLLAILVDRLSLSARSLAWAALAIMIWSPYAATGSSFQMSFAAVAGLIAFYEAFRERIGAWYSHAGPARRLGLHLVGIVLTTVISTLATTAFTIYHFNRLAAYSVLANIIAVPITGLWVLPWAIIACLLMPLGLERLALVPMGWGIDLIAAIAHIVTALPGAAFNVPAMPSYGLMVLAFGGFWLCAWRRRWRLWGLVPVAAGFCSILLAQPPDLLIDGEATAVAVRGADGSYFLTGATHGNSFVTDTWNRRSGNGPVRAWPERGQSSDERLDCGGAGCLYRAEGHTVLLLPTKTPQSMDCAGVELTLVTTSALQGCGGGAVLDRSTIRATGGYAIWLDSTGIRMVSARDWRGDRPWVPVAAARLTRLNISAASPPAVPAP